MYVELSGTVMVVFVKSLPAPPWLASMVTPAVCARAHAEVATATAIAALENIFAERLLVALSVVMLELHLITRNPTGFEAAECGVCGR